MSDLSSKPCEVCRHGASPATADEIKQFMSQLPDWDIIDIEGVPRLIRSITFKSFKQALTFTNQVGTIAEAEQHHPAILTEWGKVTISWWTHKIGGLHRNDFIMAAKTDRLLAEG